MCVFAAVPDNKAAAAAVVAAWGLLHVAVGGRISC
jgi:hypothetical protein